MKVEQLYTNCLSEAAYFIVDNGEAAIIDPIRDIEQYLKLAEQHKAKIKYIFETHFHADFVSGHLELAERTGAKIIYGPSTKADFNFYEAKDGETFKLGNATIQVLHTPGHTLESSCFLLSENEHPYCVFTGDTLFVGDVGRPDLFSGNKSKEELASMMYHSLEKLKSLSDEVIVYPAHGPGSACGKQLGSETFSTIGVQKSTNYALNAKDEKDFIQKVTDGLKVAPVYFPKNAKMNSQKVPSLESILKGSSKSLSVEGFEQLAKDENNCIIDSRDPKLFTLGFVPNSINIGLNGRFAEWAGKLISYEQPIAVVTDEGKEEETITRLARVGFSNIIGYLNGGYAAWEKSGKTKDMIVDVTVDELSLDFPFDKKLEIIDVRNVQEFDNGHLQGAQVVCLDEFTNPVTLAELDDDKNLYVHCAGGYRSVIACSLMKKNGIHNIRNVLGGWNAICQQESLPIVLPQNN